jgi:hypothetical protein
MVGKFNGPDINHADLKSGPVLVLTLRLGTTQHSNKVTPNES